MDKEKIWDDIVKKERVKAIYEMPEQVRNFLIHSRILEYKNNKITIQSKNETFTFERLEGTLMKSWIYPSTVFTGYGTTFKHIFSLFDDYIEKMKKEDE